VSNGGFFYYGLTEFLLTVRAVLEDIAEIGQTITYEELVEQVTARRGSCSPHWQMGAHLGRISHWERANGRPLLSAIVVNRDGSIGPGFWKMVEEEMQIPVVNREAFLTNTQLQVWAYRQALVREGV